MNKIIDISELVRPAPKPETVEAVLHCEKCDCPTRHRFMGSRELRTKAISTRTFDYIYTCTECTSNRPWGNAVQDLR